MQCHLLKSVNCLAIMICEILKFVLSMAIAFFEAFLAYLRYWSDVLGNKRNSSKRKAISITICLESKNKQEAGLKSGGVTPSCDNSDSDWDVVSAEVGKSLSCKHARTTKRGSNHFVSQVRCKDCGELLSKVDKGLPPVHSIMVKKAQ